MAQTPSKPGAPELLLLFGPPAVGKMTVGQELAKVTDYRLLHNHRVIDLLTDYFEFASGSFTRVARTFLDVFFEEAAASGLRVIFTMGWRFDEPENAEMVAGWMRPFVERGGRVSFVELRAPLEVRLERNESANRRAHKKVDWSTREHLAQEDRSHRWHSDGDFPWRECHLVLENAALPPQEAARRIKEHFGL
jgi:hypothetical protein